MIYRFVGVYLYGFVIDTDSLLELSHLAKNLSQVTVCGLIVRVERNCCSVVIRCVFELSFHLEAETNVVVSTCIVGLQGETLAVGRDGLIPFFLLKIYLSLFEIHYILHLLHLLFMLILEMGLGLDLLFDFRLLPG
jgi:hypothetical protein